MKCLGGLLLSTLLLLGSMDVVLADPGVSISTGRIDVTDRLAPGGRYHLPTLTVSNIGDRPARYAVTINYLEQADNLARPPRSWFNISPARFDLAPGESGAVAVSLDLPASAEPDSYVALIAAHPEAPQDGMAVIAGAAARVQFTVKPSNWLEAWRLRVTRAIDDGTPWSYVVPTFAIVALFVYNVRRRLKIRIELERRQ